MSSVILTNCSTECDRSFTRSDALAKHMRTVHETEALRPSDPVPKSMQSGPTGRTGKLKIIIKTPQSQSAGQDDGDDANGEVPPSECFTALTSELFTEEELELPLAKLWRKCHWEATWAEEVGEALKNECKQWEDLYYKEWLEKEVLLAQVIQSEVDWHERRQAIISGAADVQLPSSTEERDEETGNGVHKEAVSATADKE